MLRAGPCSSPSLWFWKALAAGAVPLDFLIALLALARPGPARWLGAASLAFATAMHLVVASRFAAPLRGALLWPAGAVSMSALTWRSGFLAWWRQGVSKTAKVLPAALKFG